MHSSDTSDLYANIPSRHKKYPDIQHLKVLHVPAEGTHDNNFFSHLFARNIIVTDRPFFFAGT